MIQRLAEKIDRFRFTPQALIIFILAAGAALRFWNLSYIPLTHDEYSAIIRCQVDNFGELINKGIRPDGHPAGIQVLIYLLVNVFGISSIALKTPFILFGLLSVFLVFKIGKMWFGETTGLLSSAFISFLQYTVMYSQVARPYASGLFFSLLMVYFWTKILIQPGTRIRIHLAGFAISAALCGYDHHFCALFAITVGITGLFIVQRSLLVKYLAACLAALLLYLPHLSILFSQMATGGIEGWLQKPRLDFPVDYLQYVFHFSIPVYILTALLILAGIYFRQRNAGKGRLYLISLSWFLVPILAGLAYSHLRSAVLQYSVLIFTFPYLLFILFGAYGRVRPAIQTALVMACALVLISSLVVERKHYHLFYNHPYNELIAGAAAAQNSAVPVAAVLDAKKEITPYILAREKSHDVTFTFLEDIGGSGRLARWLDSIPEQRVAFGALPSTAWESYAVIREKFPRVALHQPYAGGDFYIFSREAGIASVPDYFSVFIQDFETVPGDWQGIAPGRMTDSVHIDGSKAYAVDTISEFGPTFRRGLRDMIRTHDDVIDVTADFRLPQVFPGAWMVITVTSGERTIYWRSVAVTEFVKPGSSGKVFVSLRVSDIDMRHHGLQFSAYLWNPLKRACIMDNFMVRVRDGNPYLYGLYRKVPLCTP